MYFPLSKLPYIVHEGAAALTTASVQVEVSLQQNSVASAHGLVFKCLVVYGCAYVMQALHEIARAESRCACRNFNFELTYVGPNAALHSITISTADCMHHQIAGTSMDVCECLPA